MGTGEPWEERRLRAAILSHLARRKHAAVSWTGGEPLLYAGYIGGLLSWIGKLGLANVLETNGLLAGRLKPLLGGLDSVSMDLKFPSATGRGVWARQEEFLRVAAGKVCVKTVLTKETTDDEWRRALELMCRHAPRAPFYLQPATRVPSSRGEGRIVEPIEPERALRYLVLARLRLAQARLQPQWHPLWRVK